MNRKNRPKGSQLHPNGICLPLEDTGKTKPGPCPGAVSRLSMSAGWDLTSYLVIGAGGIPDVPAGSEVLAARSEPPAHPLPVLVH